jgi:hypothetical protein
MSAIMFVIVNIKPRFVCYKKRYEQSNKCDFT